MKAKDAYSLCVRTGPGSDPGGLKFILLEKSKETDRWHKDKGAQGMAASLPEAVEVVLRDSLYLPAADAVPPPA